jgi:hypothetical protein
LRKTGDRVAYDRAEREADELMGRGFKLAEQDHPDRLAAMEFGVPGEVGHGRRPC